MIRLFVISLVIFFATRVEAQDYWLYNWGTPASLWKISVNCFCPDSCTDAVYNFSLPTQPGDMGFSMTPSKKLYAFDEDGGLFLVDSMTGNVTYIVNVPEYTVNSFDQGLCTPDDDHFYYSQGEGVDTLKVFELSSGTFTNVVLLDLKPRGDLIYWLGKIYYKTGCNYQAVTPVLS